MRIKWRGLELPGRVVLDEAVSTDRYGRFIAEPFEQGFGTTIGNSLRRVLLSTLDGAAITSVKLDGVAHEFSTLEGILEDITDVFLNIKGIVVKFRGDEPAATIMLRRDKAGEVCAGDVEAGADLAIVNPDHHIATLTANVRFHAEMTVKRGRGYATAAENRAPEQEIGVIPIDSVYSPVLRVRYRTEDMRVGQRTNYDRLILEIWTNGTIRPEDALVEAGIILRKHLNPFVMYHELGAPISPPPLPTHDDQPETDTALEELLNKPVSVLNLSVRASNCLEAARILQVRDLVSKTEADLLRVRSFGKTSLDEVQAKLADMNLKLGMDVGDGTSSQGAEMQDGAESSYESAQSDEGGSSVRNASGSMEVYTMGD